MIADHGFFSGFQKFEIPRIAVAGKFHFPRPAQAGAVSVPFVKRLRKKHCGAHDSDFFSNPPAETEPPHGGTVRGGIHDEEKHRRSVVLFEKIIPAERREKVNRRSGLKSA